MTDQREWAPIRASEIKERNERLVLGMVFHAAFASQSEITVASGLKAPTVFRIFGELERLGLIAPVSTPPAVATDRKGRRPTWYNTVPGAYRVVGLDFRAGAVSVVIEDFSAKVLYAEERTIPAGANAEEAYAVVSKLASDALEATPGGPLLGIGVGAPGVVDMAHGTVHEYKRIKGLSGFPLAARLAKFFGATVRMGNNATVAAMAAYRYGSAVGAAGNDMSEGSDQSEGARAEPSSFFALLVRSGVGGAFVRSGVPYENGGKTALEIGHMTMDPDGPPCPCGNNGCLEAYLSEDSLVASANSARPFSGFKELDAALAASEAPVFDAIRPAVRQASVALLNVRHMLDPDEVIVISRSAALSSFIASEAERYLSESLRPDGRAPKVRGYRWDPILAGRASCDMVFDGFFA